MCVCRSAILLDFVLDLVNYLGRFLKLFLRVPYAGFFLLISTNVGDPNLQNQSGLLACNVRLGLEGRMNGISKLRLPKTPTALS